VHFLKMVKQQGRKRMFSLQSDLDLLQRKIIEVGDVRLVVIDPVSAYMGVGKVDSYRTTDVRAVLGPLVDMAGELKIAEIGVMHFNKKTDVTNALLRISDSLAYGAAARHVYGVVADPENARKLLVKAKNNLAAQEAQKTLGYTFHARQVAADPDTGDPITAPYIEFEPAYIDVSAIEAMQAATEFKSPAARSEAKEFLKAFLAGGDPIKARDVFDAAEGESISERTLKRAKKELKVTSVKEGGEWFWSLPDMSRKDAKETLRKEATS
jgi:hypothetical protein